MHEFVNYTEEEKTEFLARARLLKHDFVYGDWAWHPDGIFLIYEIHPSNAMFRSSDGIMDIPEKRKPLTIWESWVWLPSLDDIVRMDGWKDGILVKAFFHKDARWCVFEGLRDMEDASPLSRAPHPCLAALRAIQYCKYKCNFGNKCSQCLGIHTDGFPHRCAEHVVIQ